MSKNPLFYNGEENEKKLSGIHTRIRITTESLSLLEGHLLPMSAKFGRRLFPRSSVILFITEITNYRKYKLQITEITFCLLQNDRMNDRSHNFHLLAEVIIAITTKARKISPRWFKPPPLSIRHGARFAIAHGHPRGCKN